MSDALISKLENVLPQTQCGLCGYKGCAPYAEAIAQGREAIDRCPPGGIETLCALAHVMGKDPAPYIEGMRARALPPQVVVIEEAECIGCTKCLQVCPVDAIVGAAQQMHTVISDLCTGCSLCIPPCPMDCIHVVPGISLTQEKSRQARQRFEARQKRLQSSHLSSLSESSSDQAQGIQTKVSWTPSRRLSAPPISPLEIQAAVQRVKAKKQRI